MSTSLPDDDRSADASHERVTEVRGARRLAPPDGLAGPRCKRRRSRESAHSSCGSILTIEPHQCVTA
ncbi:hypothetical protein ACO2Q3_24560 [Caulobacter sp. KR2-114]|uniref:hypothetical protein n=1 Tax=Caulobacter sp. KR2-114 TaxID=3400912 RepID=UPI003C0FF3EE